MIQTKRVWYTIDENVEGIPQHVMFFRDEIERDKVLERHNEEIRLMNKRSRIRPYNRLKDWQRRKGLIK